MNNDRERVLVLLNEVNKSLKKVTTRIDRLIGSIKTVTTESEYQDKISEVKLIVNMLGDNYGQGNF